MKLSGKNHSVPSIEHLEPRLLLSATYPDLQAIVAPSDDPTLPGAMDDFSPPVDASTPAGSTPAAGDREAAEV